MMSLEVLALVTLALSALPAAMILVNLALYRTPRKRRPTDTEPAVSVLIPARDEERSIATCVESALASRGVRTEVIVLDDGSQDKTAEIVQTIADRDPRVRLIAGAPLPTGWCGKQHACHQLAQAATSPLLAFIDADVRLSRDGLERMASFLESKKADLVSGVPRQQTDTVLEKSVVPLIHFILLGFLPMLGMRISKSPAFAAGCGQLFLARRDAYRQMGGHATIRESRHDGVKLPKAFRQADLKTDLCDATRVAECRMYRSASEVWRGFAKNADEGMASPTAIGPWTVLLGGGQVLPPILLITTLLTGSPAMTWASLSCLLAWGSRGLLTARFRQSWLGAVLHPFGVATVLAIQWYALLASIRGRQIEWKGRLPNDENVEGAQVEACHHP